MTERTKITYDVNKRLFIMMSRTERFALCRNYRREKTTKLYWIGSKSFLKMHTFAAFLVFLAVLVAQSSSKPCGTFISTILRIFGFPRIFNFILVLVNLPIVYVKAKTIYWLILFCRISAEVGGRWKRWGMIHLQMSTCFCDIFF